MRINRKYYQKEYDFNRATHRLKHFARNPYAWPGGYPCFAVMSNGDCLCHKCIKEEYRQIYQATKTGSNCGFSNTQANWEDPNLYCAHCSERIESAYAEPE
jgi:hypothetical protein